MTPPLSTALLFISLLASSAGSETPADQTKQDVSNATGTSATDTGSLRVGPLPTEDRAVINGSPLPRERFNTSTTTEGKVDIKQPRRHPPPNFPGAFSPRRIPQPADTTQRYPTTTTTTHPHDCKKQRRHCDDDTQSRDVKPLFASSSTGDLLDDAEIYELISLGGVQTTDKQLKKKLKPHLARIARRGAVSRGTYRRISRVFRLLFIPLILVGLVTNVIAARVFWRLAKNVTNTYMTGLVLMDIGYLLLVVSTTALVIIFRVGGVRVNDTGHVLYVYVAYKFLILSLRQVIVSVTAFMSLDRYLVISSPFTRRSFLICRRPRLLMGLVTLLVLAFNSHRLLTREVRTGQVPDTPDNSTAFFLTPTPLYLRHRSLLDNLAIAGSVLFQYCPLLVMLLTNVSLMVSLHRYSRRVSTHTCDTPVTARRSPAPDPPPRTEAGSPSRRSSQGSTSSSTSSLSTRSKTPQSLRGSQQSISSSTSGLSARSKTPQSPRGSQQSISSSTSSLSTRSKTPQSLRGSQQSISSSTSGPKTPQSPRGSKQFFQLERRKCVTVITYSLLFLFLALPLALLPLLKKAFPEFNTYRSQHYLFLVYVRCHPLLDIISASVNFFVFVIKGGAFRAGVRRLVTCERLGSRSGTFKLRTVSAGLGGERDEGAAARSASPSVVLRESIKLGEN